MTCSTREQRLRQSAVHLLRRISESILSHPARLYDEDRTVYNIRNVKSEAELAVDVL